MGIRTRSEPTLLNRQRERAVLDGLLGDLRSGRGRALVVRGEAGVGKSALLEHMAGAAAEMRVARVIVPGRAPPASRGGLAAARCRPGALVT